MKRYLTPAALAAKKATSTIPIIIAAAFDPVGAGLAASLARPGGNVTGLGLFIPEVSAKGLTLLKEAVPSLTRVAVLWNAANPALALVWKDVETTARASGLVLHSEQVSKPQDFEAYVKKRALELAKIDRRTTVIICRAWMQSVLCRRCRAASSLAEGARRLRKGKAQRCRLQGTLTTSARTIQRRPLATTS